MSWTVHEPLGVVLAITPWNDPLLTPARKLAPALIAGNTVVLKPASDTPGIAIELAGVLHDAGLPPGVLNTVTGAGRRIGDALLDHPALKAVSFTGSNDVGDSLRTALAGRDVRLLAELGGKNAAVVLADADLDRAITSIAAAAFAQAGQRCTATSRVLAHREVLDAVRDGLAKAAAGHVLGPGVRPGVSMGPLVSPAQRDSVEGFVERALIKGATRATPDDQVLPSEHGCYVAPTVLTDVEPGMEIWTDEVFGPVVALVGFDTLDEALDLVNSSEFGLAAAVYTSDLGAAHAFATRADVGQVAVNAPTSGWDVHMPFGGYKRLGVGPQGAGPGGPRLLPEDEDRDAAHPRVTAGMSEHPDRDYRHWDTITTRWMDNDMYGHVNNVQYYSFFDSVVTSWLVREGGLDPWRGEVIGLCVESQCTFAAPLELPRQRPCGPSGGPRRPVERPLRARPLRGRRVRARSLGTLRARLRRPAVSEANGAPGRSAQGAGHPHVVRCSRSAR